MSEAKSKRASEGYTPKSGGSYVQKGYSPSGSSKAKLPKPKDPGPADGSPSRKSD